MPVQWTAFSPNVFVDISATLETKVQKTDVSSYACESNKDEQDVC